jgi:hypothetical protein
VLMGAAQTGDPQGLKLLLAAGILPQPEEVQRLAVQLAGGSMDRHPVGYNTHGTVHGASNRQLLCMPVQAPTVGVMCPVTQALTT